MPPPEEMMNNNDGEEFKNEGEEDGTGDNFGDIPLGTLGASYEGNNML